jgi:hypothetical protein
MRLTWRPFPDRRLRAQRLHFFGLGLLAFAVLAVWNPVAHPGPKFCLLRHAVGLPCPLCGLTRGTALVLRGRWVEGSYYNPLAVPCVVVGALLVMKWAVEYRRNQRLQIVWGRRALTLLAVVVPQVVVLASWAYLLRYRREDDFAESLVGQLWHTVWP